MKPRYISRAEAESRLRQRCDRLDNPLPDDARVPREIEREIYDATHDDVIRLLRRIAYAVGVDLDGRVSP